MTSNTETPIDIEYLKGWEGKTIKLEDGLSPFPAQALAGVFNRDERPHPGGTLPPCWQWLYFLDTPSGAGTGADGHPATGGFLPPSPLPRRMWAAGKFSILRPLELGQTAQKTSRIASVDLKAGKSGVLLFVNVEHDIAQAGQLCVRETQNIVYREMPQSAAPLPPGESAPEDKTDIGAQWRETITPDPVMLFRYSALTYNSHRIHYDRDYAVNTEFYPALVVHGPLLASLLAESASRQFPGERIDTFSFRAQRPTFDDQPFQVCGRRDGDKLTLWTVDHEGFVGMKASATLTSAASSNSEGEPS